MSAGRSAAVASRSPEGQNLTLSKNRFRRDGARCAAGGDIAAASTNGKSDGARNVARKSRNAVTTPSRRLRRASLLFLLIDTLSAVVRARSRSEAGRYQIQYYPHVP